MNFENLFETLKKENTTLFARGMAAEMRLLTQKLLLEPYESAEEFREDLKTLHDKATALDEVLKK